MALRPSSSTHEFLERTCSVTKNERCPEPYTQTKLVTTRLNGLKVVGFHNKHEELASSEEYSGVLIDYHSACN
jgi:hypothetical protein